MEKVALAFGVLVLWGLIGMTKFRLLALIFGKKTSFEIPEGNENIVNRNGAVERLDTTVKQERLADRHYPELGTDSILKMNGPDFEYLVSCFSDVFTPYGCSLTRWNEMIQKSGFETKGKLVPLRQFATVGQKSIWEVYSIFGAIEENNEVDYLSSIAMLDENGQWHEGDYDCRFFINFSNNYIKITSKIETVSDIIAEGMKYCSAISFNSVITGISKVPSQSSYNRFGYNWLITVESEDGYAIEFEEHPFRDYVDQLKIGTKICITGSLSIYQECTICRVDRLSIL
ncbi:hypothetical protein [Cohnella yongneupensis]|uniref:Uncharacterized protein n=1 Tax=Cohnella yongneupensis TaxID=425006 RepID=A0ABW0R317_9BACL